MESKILTEEVEEAKDFHGRKFKSLTGNFYIMKAALRYYSVKKGMSITSTRVADDFPLTVPVAGSCLSVLDEINVIQKRKETSSQDRYLPEEVDLERLKSLEKILVENYEIDSFSEKQ